MKGSRMKFIAVLAMLPATICFGFFFFRLGEVMIAMYLHPETVAYDVRLALALLALVLGVGILLGFTASFIWGLKTLCKGRNHELQPGADPIRSFETGQT